MQQLTSQIFFFELFSRMSIEKSGIGTHILRYLDQETAKGYYRAAPIRIWRVVVMIEGETS